MLDKIKGAIEYQFTMENGRVLNYKIPFVRTGNRQLSAGSQPEWTRLSFQQCGNCPLSSQTETYCPVAVDAADIIMSFGEILSFNEAEVRVFTNEREYSKQCDAQTGLRSLIGFVMATSACPVLSPLRGLAYYHLPFAALDEILFRVTSSYLLTQYYVYKAGGQADLELSGLKAQFEEIQALNYDFLQRIRVASQADSSLDVLSTLFSIASLISVDLDSHLEKLRPLFLPPANATVIESP